MSRSAWEPVDLRQSWKMICLDGLLLLLPLIVPWYAFRHISAWPQNDDPFYGRPVSHYVKHGSFQIYRQHGELTATSLAHLFVGGVSCSLLGFSYHNLFLACVLQQWLGAMSIYAFGSVILADRKLALLLAFTLCLFPLYWGHAFTFMTDGPATAWAAFSISALAVGLIRGNTRWLLVGSIAVAWGFWIRQTNLLLLIAPIAAICIGSHAIKTPMKRQWLLLAVTVIPLLAMGLLESSWLVHSDQERLSTIAPDPWSMQRLKTTVISLYGLGLLLGLFTLPILPWMFREYRRRMLACGPLQTRLCHTIFALTLIAWLLPFVATQGRACLTNSTGCFLQNGHWGPIFLSDMDEPQRWGDLGGVAWPLFIWKVLTIGCIVGISTIAGWMTWCGSEYWLQRRTLPSQNALLSIANSMLICIFVSVVLMLCMVKPLLDRYWLFLFPPLLVWIFALIKIHSWQLGRFSGVWAAATLAAFFGLSLIYTRDSLVWNDLRWQYVHQFIEAGHAPKNIDGGRDVNAWLRMDEDPDTHCRPGDDSAWWTGHATYCIAVGDRPGWSEIERLPWRSWATGRQHHLLILSKNSSPQTFPPLLAGQE